MDEVDMHRFCCLPHGPSAISRAPRSAGATSSSDPPSPAPDTA